MTLLTPLNLRLRIQLLPVQKALRNQGIFQSVSSCVCTESLPTFCAEVVSIVSLWEEKMVQAMPTLFKNCPEESPAKALSLRCSRLDNPDYVGATR